MEIEPTKILGFTLLVFHAMQSKPTFKQATQILQLSTFHMHSELATQKITWELSVSNYLWLDRVFVHINFHSFPTTHKTRQKTFL